MLFRSVLDDAAQAINHVMRGDDLLPSTALQIHLQALLGLPTPAYLHLPLVVGTDGRRLAKRHGDTRLAQFRENGVTGARVVGFLAHRGKLIDRDDAITAAELLSQCRGALNNPAPGMLDVLNFFKRTIPAAPLVLTTEEIQLTLQKPCG